MSPTEDPDADAAIERLGAAARERGLRIAVAESLTCGRLASRIGAAAEASEWFAGGIVAYQVRTKHDVLGVPEGVDPCSAECAEQLASGVRELLRADVAVSATGVGGPDPENGHAPGTVYLGWATADASGHRLLDLGGDPDQVLDATVAAAVDLLLETVATA